MLKVFHAKLKAIRFMAALVVCVAGSACSLLEHTYEPRAYQINLGTQNVRENLILLNVARASRFEPMNFTALSKYTATGLVQAGTTGSLNSGVNFEAYKGGPTTPQLPFSGPSATLGGSGSTSASNTFDIASLDNQDFYANFLAPLTPEKVHILVNAGLSRDVVFHSVIRSVKVTLGPSGRLRVRPFKELRYNNNPEDDAWGQENSPETHRRCEEIMRGEARKNRAGRSTPPFQSEYWVGDHLHDCNYSKFLRFIKAGLEYGLTTEVIREARGQRSTRIPQLNIVVTQGGGGGAGGGSGGSGGSNGGGDANSNRVKICFDASLASEYGNSVPEGATYSSCEMGDAKTQLKIALFEPYVETVTPVLQSAYSVFQYYGLLVRSHTADRVELTSRAKRFTGDDRIFYVEHNGEGGCYAFVSYSGKDYCVPQENAGNTKEVLTLLVALVNLSTSRNSLPVTPTVLTNPQ